MNKTNTQNTKHKRPEDKKLRQRTYKKTQPTLQHIHWSELRSTRAIAAQVLNTLIQKNESLNTLLPKASTSLSPRDKALVQELSFGCCRWHAYILNVYRPFLKHPLSRNDSLVEALIVVGCYQLLYMRVPNHAAINETVNAAEELGLQRFKSLLNAVLRRVAEKQEALEAEGDQAAIDSYPQWIVEKLKHNWPEHWQTILTEGNQRPPMTLRVNAAFNTPTLTTAQYIELLQTNGIDASPGKFAPQSVTLAQASNVEQLPYFQEGGVSVQDEAAQLCCQLLKLESGQRILDACAAPGGKSGAILEAQPDAKLTALDIDAERAQRIHENLKRLKLSAQVLTAAAEDLDSWWDKTAFDRILLDAPCSATGVIRRHPDIKLLRKEQDIVALAKTQISLLSSLWPTLKPGGYLLYATCSVFPQENSRIIERFLKKTPNTSLAPIDAQWGIETGFGRQLFPETHGHDGFFYALLRKSEDTSESVLNE